MDKRKAEEEAKEKAKIAQRAAGKLTGMSGKDMFAYGTDFLGEEEVSRTFTKDLLCCANHIHVSFQEEDDDWDLQQYLAERDPASREEKEADEENDLRGSSDVEDDDDDGDTGRDDEKAESVNGVTEQLQETSIAA
jgi:hypothetical protein